MVPDYDFYKQMAERFQSLKRPTMWGNYSAEDGGTGVLRNLPKGGTTYDPRAPVDPKVRRALWEQYVSSGAPSYMRSGGSPGGQMTVGIDPIGLLGGAAGS